MSLKVVTANRLRDGRVVYLAADGWSEDIADASLLSEEEARAVASPEVVEPYLIEVADGSRRPVRRRERIRAAGPTVQTALNRSRGSE